MPNLNLPTINGLIELVHFDTTQFGGQAYYYANSKMDDGQEIEQSSFTFNGVTYITFPFLTEGYAAGGDEPPKPSITVPDFGGQLLTELRLMGGAPGAPITRYMVLAEDVAADNAAGIFSEENYFLNRYMRSNQMLTLELASPWDFAKTKLPSCRMMRDEYPGLGSALTR